MKDIVLQTSRTIHVPERLPDKGFDGQTVFLRLPANDYASACQDNFLPLVPSGFAHHYTTLIPPPELPPDLNPVVADDVHSLQTVNLIGIQARRN